jgi:hypothetical protein
MNCFQRLSGSRGATDKPPRGGATKKKADSTTPHALSASNTHAHHNQAHCTTALAHLPSLLTERATHAHPLHPAALAFVPYGIVLVRVRVPFPGNPMARAGIPTEIITLPRVCCTVSLLQLSLPLVALSLFFSSLLAAAPDYTGVASSTPAPPYYRNLNSQRPR